MSHRRPPRLLAVSDARERARRSFESWLDALVEAGIGGLLVREKHLDDRQLYDLLRRVRRRWPADRLLVVSTRLDVALAAGADGVHLPADGLPIAPLRRRFGPEPWIGRSTHRPDEVRQARDDGADYATFGPILVTPSKVRYGSPPGWDGLRQAAAAGLPILALGGLGPRHLALVAGAGASGAAGIQSFHDPAQLTAWGAATEHTWPRRSPAAGPPETET